MMWILRSFTRGNKLVRQALREHGSDAGKVKRYMPPGDAKKRAGGIFTLLGIRKKLPVAMIQSGK